MFVLAAHRGVQVALMAAVPTVVAALDANRAEDEVAMHGLAFLDSLAENLENTVRLDVLSCVL